MLALSPASSWSFLRIFCGEVEPSPTRAALPSRMPSSSPHFTLTTASIRRATPSGNNPA